MSNPPQLYFAAVDIKKSFDTINQKKLYDILESTIEEVGLYDLLLKF